MKARFLFGAPLSAHSQSVRTDKASSKAPQVEQRVPGSGRQHPPTPAAVMGSGCAHHTNGASRAQPEFRLRKAFNQEDGNLDGLQDMELKQKDHSNACHAPRKTES